MDNNKSGVTLKDIARPTIKQTTLTSDKELLHHLLCQHTGLSDKPKMKQSETYQENRHIGTAKVLIVKKFLMKQI